MPICEPWTLFVIASQGGHYKEISQCFSSFTKSLNFRKMFNTIYPKNQFFAINDYM